MRERVLKWRQRRMGTRLVWIESTDGNLRLCRYRNMWVPSEYFIGVAQNTRLQWGEVYLSKDGTCHGVPDCYWHMYKRGEKPETKAQEKKQNEVIAAQLAAQALSVGNWVTHPAQNVGMMPMPISSVMAQQQAMMQYMQNQMLPSPFSYNLTGLAVPADPSPRPKLDTDTRLVHPVSGWRRWSVDCFGMKLKSNNKTVWEPRAKLTAECKRTDEADCDGIHCHCGIYAYKERAASETGENAPSSETHIWGEVWLWGRIVEHEQGFRAQYAYPKAFVRSGIAEQLSEVYGVKLID